MKKLWVAMGVALIVSGCGSDEVRSSKTDIEQRRLIDQENAAREARVRQEQEELARIRAEQRKREQAGAQAAQAEAPVVRPIEQENIEQEPIKEPEVNTPPVDPTKAFATRTIYYDYDAYNVKEEYLAVMQAHSKFLLAHKEVKLRIEGNCDERGSREYNLALGQRRADSVKRALMLMGVPPRQIESVSFGSEKPKSTSHDEQAYAENRRSDLVYVGGETALR
jgi:peptidoglycan-associated lipoprotein